MEPNITNLNVTVDERGTVRLVRDVRGMYYDPPQRMGQIENPVEAIRNTCKHGVLLPFERYTELKIKHG